LTYIRPEVLAYIYEECSKSNELTLEIQNFLIKLVEYSMEGSQPLWIIIDGLDECDRKEKKIMTWVMAMVNAETNTGRIRLFVISQDDGDMRKVLTKNHVISLSNTAQHEEAIRMFAAKKSVKLKEKFDLTSDAERNITEIITVRSKGELFIVLLKFGFCNKSSVGMFLFARLALKHLKNQISLHQLETELNPARFPSELYEM